MGKQPNTNINPKTQKEFANKIKDLEENDSRRRNQYITLFREHNKLKGRIIFLEGDAFKFKEEAKKLFTHFGDELFAMQSTLDFFTCDEPKDEDTTTVEEKEEARKKQKEKKKKEIMGVDFSDAILIPEKTK